VPEPTADGARLQICADRACTTVLASIDTTSASARPSSDLPIGVVFWRLSSRVAGTLSAAVSPTWQFTVGARSAAVDASWGSTPDVNGDGHPDLVVSAPYVSGNNGRVYVYDGSASGLGAAPSVTLSPARFRSDQGFGLSIASAGDVNGDGYADVVIGSPGVNAFTGSAFVYLGGASGLSTIASATLTAPSAESDHFGGAVLSAGDVNGDGYADVVVGARGAVSRTGRAYLYLGGASGIGIVPAATFTGPDGIDGSFGAAIASGDLNGDGYGDVVFGASRVIGDTGRAYVHLGSALGLATTATVTLTGPDTSGEFGGSLASAGDVNGDGYADLVVGAEAVNDWTGAAYVYLGSSAGLAATPSSTLGGSGVVNDGFGGAVACAGDVDGNGYADVLVGSPRASSALGMAYLFLGASGGIAIAPSATLPAPDGPDGSFGSAVGTLGDLDGDGFAEAIVGAPYLMSNIGRAYVYAGRASGLVATPSTTFSGPAGVDGFFGWSFAHAM
jgi:hypothetical protein